MERKGARETVKELVGIRVRVPDEAVSKLGYLNIIGGINICDKFLRPRSVDSRERVGNAYLVRLSGHFGICEQSFGLLDECVDR